MPEETASSFKPVIAGTRIGHVHLKVADLDRALAFIRVYSASIDAALRRTGCFYLRWRLSPSSASTHGIAKAASRRRKAQRACFTLRSCTRPALPSPMLCIGFFLPASLLTARATMASARRFTCAIRMRMASNCIGIAPRRNGRVIRTERWQCSLTGLTLTRCCERAKRSQTGCEVFPRTSTMVAAITCSPAHA